MRAGSKLNTYHVHPERPASSMSAAGALRRPIRLAGPPCRPRRPTVHARCRAARDCLDLWRRARAARVSTFRELPDRARLHGLTFVFVSAGLSVCGLYVSCRVSESVLVGTRGFCIELSRYCVIRVSYCENFQQKTTKTLPTTLPVVSMCCLFCALDVSVHKPARTRTRR